METSPQDNKKGLREQEESIVDIVLQQRPLSQSERLLPYLLAAMETCWVGAILIGLAGVTHIFFLPLWAPFVLIAGSYWLSNALEQGRSGTQASLPITLFVVALLVGTMLFSLWSGIYSTSTAFFDPTWLGNTVSDLLLLSSAAVHIVAIIALTLYFYWRGLRLSHGGLEPGRVFNSIRIGIGVILAVMAIQAITGSTSSNGVFLLLLVPLFLLFALAAHSLAQTTFMRSTHHMQLQGSTASNERAILGIVTAFGTVLILVSLLIGAIVSPAFLTNAQHVLEPVELVYTAIANVIALAMTLLITPIIWLLNLFHFRLQNSDIQIRTTSALCKQYPKAPQCLKTPSAQNSVNPLLVLSIKFLLPLLVIILLLLIVRLLLRRRRASTIHRRITEFHESLWSWELFWTQIRAFFRALWLRLFPQHKEAIHVQEQESDVATSPMARSIREVYRAMLRWAAQHGYPRKRDETPYEFNIRLRAGLPSTEPEAGAVTEAYIAVRYGRVAPSEAEVTHIQQTWQQLQRKTADTN